MHGYKRDDEFVDFFRQLTSIVKNQTPDALLVSGDVYHSAAPSIATQTLYTETMLRLHEACPTMEIIVTAGNHDSASRLEVDRSLWRHFRVHVVGGLARNDQGADYDRHIFPIGDKGFVAAVPHVFRQNFPHLQDKDADRQKAFYQGLLDRVGELNADGRPVVLMAHLAVAQGLDGKQPYQIGGMDYEPLSVLGQGYDYAALGHIHHPQQVPAHNPHVRYAGAPLAITFNEEFEHSVSLVEVLHGETPRIKVLPIKLLRPVRNLPQEPSTLDEAFRLLKELPPEEACYVRLNVHSSQGLPIDVNEKAIRLAVGKKCRFCYVNLVVDRPRADSDAMASFTPDELRMASPLVIAERYLRRRGLPTEMFLEMMRQTIQMIEEEKAQ